MAIYSLADGMKRIDVAENHAKNSLKIGTVLHLNGYDCPNYVIVKNHGISENFPENGAKYLTVKLEDFTQSQSDAVVLKYLSEKKDGRIRMYITDEVKSSDEVLSIWEKSEAKRVEREKTQKEAEEERQRLIIKGKELFAKYIPANAKALIIACCDIDDSDLMTDYFSHKTTETVILGYSKHTRDIFSEMRKHADKIEETKHFANVPDIDSNGDKKTEQNKSWWHPKDEHRDKYSMGAGYYLKNSWINSTGWRIQKQSKWRDGWEEGLYISIAKRCIF